jgi:hypothetical protein
MSTTLHEPYIMQQATRNQGNMSMNKLGQLSHGMVILQDVIVLLLGFLGGQTG